MKAFPILLLPGLCAAVYAAPAIHASLGARGPSTAVVEMALGADITEQVNNLIEEFTEATAAWSKAYRAASGDEQTALRSTRPSPGDTATKIMALVKADPTAEGALEACKWVGTYLRSGDPLDSALSVLTKHYAEHEAMDDLVMNLRGSSDQHIALFEAVLATNKSEKAQGFACFNIASALKSNLDRGNVSADEAKALEARAVALFERVQKDFADVIQRGDRTLGDAAGAEIFELQNLSVGKVVPDIQAEDVAGTEFKLSDYRGKVVMLDFWGDW